MNKVNYFCDLREWIHSAYCLCSQRKIEFHLYEWLNCLLLLIKILLPYEWFRIQAMCCRLTENTHTHTHKWPIASNYISNVYQSQSDFEKSKNVRIYSVIVLRFYSMLSLDYEHFRGWLLWPILFPLIVFAHRIIEFRLSGFNHSRAEKKEYVTRLTKRRLCCYSWRCDSHSTLISRNRCLFCANCLSVSRSVTTNYLSSDLSISIICNLNDALCVFYLPLARNL